MTPLFALMAVAPASATATLDASARSHAALRRFHVAATVDAVTQGRRTSVNYDLLVDGDDMRIRIVETVAQGRDKGDKTFLFRKTQVSAYDAVANERLARQVPPGLHRLGRVIFTVGPVDDLVRFLLDGSQMSDFFQNMRALRSWKVATGAKGTSLTRTVQVGASGTNHTFLRFAPKTNLLTQLELRSANSTTRWAIKYLPATKPSLNIPRSAKLVNAFTVAPEPPKFIDSAAKALADRTLRAYRNLQKGIVTVRDDAGLTKITLDGKRIREENPSVTYTYDGKNLAILDRRRAVIYRGRTTRDRIPVIMSSVGGRIDPLSRQILQDRVPLQELMVPDMVVSTGGTVEMNGVACDILKFDNPRTRVMLCVRRDIRLLDSATTNTIDRNGAPLVTTARQYRYQRLGHPQPAAQFSIGDKKGYAIRPFPKKKK